MRRALALLAVSLGLGLAAAPASAADPVAPSNTAWAGTALVKAKVPGESLTGLLELTVLFGPNPGASLEANEFEIVLDDGEETLVLTGTYSVDAKGQPVLALDTTLLAAELKDLMIHICQDVLGLGAACDELLALDVALDPERLRTKVKTASGNGDAELVFSAKLPFLLTDGVDALKFTVSIKTAPPAQLVK